MSIDWEKERVRTRLINRLWVVFAVLLVVVLVAKGVRAQDQQWVDWSVDIEQDVMTDLTKVYVYQVSRWSEGGKEYREPPGLIIRCQDGVFSVFAVWYHVLKDEIRMTSRLDDNPPETTTRLWGRGESMTTSFSWTPHLFIEQWLKHERLLLRAEIASGGTITAEWNLAGLDKALNPLRKACNM